MAIISIEDAQPSGWSTTDKCHTLIIAPNGLRVTYAGSGISHHHAASVRANHPIPRTGSLYYFEVRIIDSGHHGYIGVGLTERSVSLNRLPGWDAVSYGFHGDDGKLFVSSGQGINYGPTFMTGDVIGCGIDLRKRNLFFTKNCQHLGVAVENIPLHRDLYPIVGLQSLGEVVEANFGGRPFLFDVVDYINKSNSGT